MDNPGFWLVVAVFALGAAWPLTCALNAAANRVDAWRARRDLGAHFDQAVALGNAEGSRG